MRASRVILFVCILIFAVMASLFYFVYRASAPPPDSILLREFGVEISTPAILSDLTYEAVGVASEAVLHMQAKDIIDAEGSPCELGTFSEIQKDAVPGPESRWSQEQIDRATAPHDNIPAQVKEFTDFYLIFEPSQAVCTQDAGLTQSEADKRATLWNALVSARYAS